MLKEFSPEMVTKQKTYELLVCLTLICFGFFGSLSHFFSLLLIILIFVNYKISEQKPENGFKEKALFLVLSSCIFLFLFTNMFRSNFILLLYSLAPMLPIPFIGILIILHKRTNFKLSAKNLSYYSQFSVLFASIIYILLSTATDPNNFFYKFHAGRLSLFSGNPIPFSFVMLGLSIFCLSNWRNSDRKINLFAFFMFLSGVYLSGILSGTRGTLLTLIIISPIIIFYLTNSFKLSIFIISTVIFTAPLINNAIITYDSESLYVNRIKSGYETIILLENKDSSVFQRLEMWSAALKSISERPFFGHGITERFSALKPYLNNSKFEYTHPHNDIFAGLISSGIAGGIATTISMISAFIAALMTSQRSTEKVLLGFMISLSTLITASVSTVFFSDISSAWLAFSTYLIWTTDFKNNHS